MLPPSSTACEVEIAGVWIAMPVSRAHAEYRVNLKRCPACHGKVVTTGTYATPPKVFLSHYRAHQGCPLDPKRFTGTATLHPNALA